MLRGPRFLRLTLPILASAGFSPWNCRASGPGIPLTLMMGACIHFTPLSRYVPETGSAKSIQSTCAS